MKIADLSEAEVLRYFETRLHDHKLRRSTTSKYMALCCFHPDRTPSLSITTVGGGGWKCFTGCGEGGLVAFEKKFSSCDESTAYSRIAEIVGQSQLKMGQAPEATYSYTDVFGKELFQVVRYPGKRFTQRKPDGKGGWIYKTSDLKVVLYHLPEVVTAKNILITEGEKDCDNLRKALTGRTDIAVTTCPRGAGKWQDSFSVFCAGKQVLVIPDNDEPGRQHAETVARSVYRYAQGVKVLSLPGLPEKGDVSDFLKTNKADEIFALAKQVPWWNPPVQESSLFMTVTEFEANSAPAIDWLVEGIIQRGSNGLMIARPKAGKSFAVLDMAVALASGQRWLDFFIQRRARVALVSREDYYGLTQWRLKKIRNHRALHSEELDGWLYINAKGSKPKFMLDDQAEVAALIGDLKRYQSEFLILDVMRVLHTAEENDNTEMQKVISVLNHIQEECGTSICLIHHDNKREDASLTERARGASAIAGYAEFICGIKVADEVEWVREFACELKASVAPERFYWKINETADDGIRLERVNWSPPKNKRRKADEAKDQTSFPTDWQADD